MRRALPLQDGDSLVEPAGHFRIEIVDIEGCGHADAKAIDRLVRRGGIIRNGSSDRGQVRSVRPRHQAQQHGTILRRSRQRTDGVKRLRQRHRARTADPADRRLQAGDTAEMRRHPDRSAGVGAQGSKGQPSRDRGAGSRGRTAGDAIEVPGITHRTVMGVVASRTIGEFRHLQRAEPDSARLLEPVQRRRGRGGDEIATDPRAAGDHPAGLVIHVLVRQRHAMQGPAGLTLGKRRVGQIRQRQRFIRLDRHERIEMGLPARDAIKTGLGHLAG